MAVDEFRFEPDPRGIEEITSSGPAVDRALNEAADKAAELMRRNARTLDADDFFGMRDSISVIPARGDTSRIAIGSQDGVAFVGSDSPGWHLQEYGTARQAPRAIIRRAMRAVRGVRFEEA